MRYLFIFLFLIFTVIESVALSIPTSDRAEDVISSIKPILKNELTKKNLQYGAPVFVRIFKKESLLELWVESKEGIYTHFRSYHICAHSGDLGPKLKEGDNQSPEGFYFVGPKQLNPWSRYHLSFNLGFPNQYDRYHRRTGSALMVHGNCVSIGCYAMTDEKMNEIYTLIYAAFEAGQPFFRVHAFPFKLSDQNLSKYTSSQWYSFWLNLKEGYDYFNKHKQPPNVEVLKGQYVFDHTSVNRP